MQAIFANKVSRSRKASTTLAKHGNAILRRFAADLPGQDPALIPSLNGRPSRSHGRPFRRVPFHASTFRTVPTSREPCRSPPCRNAGRSAASADRWKSAPSSSKWLGIALRVPQLLLIFTFFYWPAGQAVYWAFTLQQPWGGGNTGSGSTTSARSCRDPVYWNSVVAQPGLRLRSAPGLRWSSALVLALLDRPRSWRATRFYRVGAGLALCHRGAGARRWPSASSWRRRPASSPSSTRSGPASGTRRSTAPTPWRRSSSPSPGNMSATISSSSWPRCRRSRAR